MAVGLTGFGKELRKLRIDRGEVLKTMSDKLGITSSYLSAIEFGKRSVPADMIQQLKELYNLNNTQIAQLEVARDRSLKDININLAGASDSHRDAALMFARTFKDLTDEEVEEMKNFLSKAQKS